MSDPRFWLASLLLIVGFAGCQPQATPALPAPTPQVIPVSLDPSIEWLRPVISACADQHPGVAVLMQEYQASALPESGSPNVIIHWGDGGQTAENTFSLGQSQLSLVLHPSSPVDELSVAQATALFSGQANSLADLQIENCEECAGAIEQVQIWLLPQESSAGQLFEAALSPFGGFTPRAKIAPSLETMRAAVEADPLAIGVLPIQSAGDQLRVMPLEGTTHPILAFIGSQPAGPLLDWLLCLQSTLSP